MSNIYGTSFKGDIKPSQGHTLFSSNRAQIISFDRHFDDDKQDHTLDTEFRKPENASGILNWMLEGCRIYLRCGLTSPDSVKAATQAYRNESDLIGIFVAEVLEKKQGTFTLAAAVYTKYQIWCEQYGYKKMSFKTFNRDIERHLESGHGKSGKIFKDCPIIICNGLSSQCGYG
jgi:putative DNA primase/helicase